MIAGMLNQYMGNCQKKKEINDHLHAETFKLHAELYLKDDQVCFVKFALLFGDVSRQLSRFVGSHGLLRIQEVL